jgi:mRNA interferase RelE/StbE
MRLYKIHVSPQVEEFVRSFAPAPKHAVRDAIARLDKQQGDIRSLENDLAGFSRLRVGRYRVIFTHAPEMTIDCLFAEERKLVYEIFGALLREQLEGKQDA